MSDYTLAPGEQKQIPLEHRYLRVEYSNLALDLSTREIPSFKVKNRDVIDFEQAGKTVLIKNTNDTRAVFSLLTEPFKVSGADEVTLSPGAEVTLSAGSTVQDVTLNPATLVGLKNGTEVGLVTGSEITTVKTGDFIGLAMLDFSTNLTQTVGSNANRKKLHIVADTANLEPVWIGSNQANIGIALYPGQAKEFEVTTQFTCYCTDNTAKAYLAEETV